MAVALVFGVVAAPCCHGSGIHDEEAGGGPTFDALVPAFDLVAAIPGVHEVDAFEHFAQREDADVEFGVVVGEPLQDGRFWTGLGRLAEDVGVNKVGHGRLGKMEVASGREIAFG